MGDYYACQIQINFMKILVFTAKWIGLKCVSYLLDNFPDDNYVFVVGNPNADLISNELEKRNQIWYPLDESTISLILSKKNDTYDWLLNLWGGHIFKNDILNKCRNSLNIHPSYLPYCKGRDPIVWAIRNGYPSGVTLHKITSGVDDGPIIYQEKINYSFPISGGELYEKVVSRAWQMFCEKWGEIRNNNFKLTPQDNLNDNKTFKRKDLIKDRIIDLNKDEFARSIFLRILAHDFHDDYLSEIIFNKKTYSAKLIIKEK